jgi:enoyl-CoA hydratase/carnithine racemase
MPNFEELVYTLNDGLATIRLNRPEVLNAFSSKLYGELRDAVRAADVDPSVDVMVVTGTGRAFGTGGDLAEVRRILASGDPLAMYRFYDNLPWDALRDSTKVIVAAINGVCLAGGLITALACDLSIATASATFGFNEAKVGVADRMAPSLLFGRVSAAKAKQLLLTSIPIDATEAERIGLITEVAPDDRFEQRVAEVVADVRRTSPVSRRLFKDYWNDLIPRPRNHGGGPAFTSAEVREGLDAFGQRRPADYRPDPR